MPAGSEGAAMRFTPPEALLREEDSLVVHDLDERASYLLGCSIADRALECGQPLAVSIQIGMREVFRVKLPGSLPIADTVLDAKLRTAIRGGHSSLYERNLRLARGTTFEEETGLTFPEHAPFGGAVPIRSGTAGAIRGWVAVTGLTQEEDHAVAVDAIRVTAQRPSIPGAPS